MIKREGQGEAPGVTAALAVVTVVWFAALMQWTLFDLVVPWDSKNQFYAFYRFMAGAIQSGSTPFWNPYHYAGHPSSADPQSLIFALPFLAWAFIDPAPSLFAFDALVLAHLLAGGWAIVYFGKREGWPAAASILAASVFMLGGVVSGRMNHVGIICAYGLFPLALLLMRISIEKNSIWSALGFALAASQIALGRSQTPLLLCALLGAALIVQIASSERIIETLKSRALVLSIMGLGALVLLAPPLILTLQFISYSNRPATPVETALLSSMHPLNLATLFSADAFGSLESGTDGWGPGSATLKDFDVTDRAFNYMFCGTLTALLLVWHGIAGGRIAAYGRRTLAIALALALAYSVGRYTPVYEWLFAHAPGVSLFRRPNDAAFIAVLCVAYLSGWLASDYIRAGAPRVNRVIAGAVAAALAAFAAASVQFAALSHKAAETGWRLAVAFLILALAGWALRYARTARARSVLMSVLVVATAGELVWRNAGNVLNARPASEYALLETPRGEDARIVEAIETDMAKTSGGPYRPRIEVLGLDGQWQNASMILGFEALNGYNPLRIGDYDELVEPGESPYDVNRRAFPRSFPSYNCGLSRRLNLRYLVLDKPLANLPRKHDVTKFTPLVEGPRAWVYRNEEESPRVTIRSQVRIAAVDDLEKAVDLLPEDGQLLVASDEPLSQVYVPRKGQQARARISDWRVDRVELDIETSAPAIVKLNSPNYPGWEAEVDGVRKPVISVDLLFRGVEVPAGARRVVFTFRPFSWTNMKSALFELLDVQREK
ncbi:MAG: hypothetical protein ACK4MV_09295 [Beijerinckiaceae bacterium]